MSSEPQSTEEGCFGKTFERKYFRQQGCFIKRTLRPSEFRHGHRGLHIPRANKERLINEAASLRYVRQHTNIPVPTVYCDFEDEEAYYLITQWVDGVLMADLSEAHKEVVAAEVEKHLATLHALKSHHLGGPTSIVIPPHRIWRQTERNSWTLQNSQLDEYSFCHNDLSQHNVIVNPDTLSIKAIIDWEYAGFYPVNFESPFYRRLGPSAAINGEEDDSLELLNFLNSKIIVSRPNIQSYPT
ncbi:kinase-like domain-containing protein [Diaporthe sp. PMI_573]|nr:kinase-like domain-containing protein [Diaporthaceae sp. PMI_573]